MERPLILLIGPLAPRARELVVRSYKYMVGMIRTKLFGHHLALLEQDHLPYPSRQFRNTSQKELFLFPLK